METTVTTIYLFKGLVILVGLAFVFMGYKLFVKGITAPVGSFTGEVGDKKVKLMRFAPGIFFALVGTVVVVVGSTRKFSIKDAGGVEAESMQAGAHGPEINDQDRLELESAGNPPMDEVTDDEPGNSRGAVEGGDREATTGSSARFSLCDTCDVH